MDQLAIDFFSLLIDINKPVAWFIHYIAEKLMEKK